MSLVNESVIQLHDLLSEMRATHKLTHPGQSPLRTSIRTYVGEDYTIVTIEAGGYSIVRATAHREPDAHRKALAELRAYLSQDSDALVSAMAATLAQRKTARQ